MAKTFHTNYTWDRSLRDISKNLAMWKIPYWRPPDFKKSQASGSVTLEIQRNGIWYPFTCNSQPSAQQNLRALGLAIEAARIAEERGIGGLVAKALELKALPAGPSAYKILGINEGETNKAVIKAAYIKRAKETHPDAGGSAEEFTKVQKAAEQLGVA